MKKFFRKLEPLFLYLTFPVGIMLIGISAFAVDHIQANYWITKYVFWIGIIYFCFGAARMYFLKIKEDRKKIEADWERQAHFKDPINNP